MLLSHTPCTVMSMTSLEQFKEYNICLNGSSLITLSTNSTVKQMCNSMLFINTNLRIIYHFTCIYLICCRIIIFKHVSLRIFSLFSSEIQEKIFIYIMRYISICNCITSLSLTQIKYLILLKTLDVIHVYLFL